MFGAAGLPRNGVLPLRPEYGGDNMICGRLAAVDVCWTSRHIVLLGCNGSLGVLFKAWHVLMVI